MNIVERTAVACFGSRDDNAIKRVIYESYGTDTMDADTGDAPWAHDKYKVGVITETVRNFCSARLRGMGAQGRVR